MNLVGHVYATIEPYISLESSDHANEAILQEKKKSYIVEFYSDHVDETISREEVMLLNLILGWVIYMRLLMKLTCKSCYST